jgi:hypothetical protein
MWVKPHQKSEKCSEFPRFSLLQKDNNYTVEIDYGNPLNPNGTTVGHLDMNSHDYTVEFVTSTHGNRFGDYFNHFQESRKSFGIIECIPTFGIDFSCYERLSIKDLYNCFCFNSPLIMIKNK